MELMIEILDKTKCCGCTSCANACPRNCIEMVMDNEGFLYPKVDLKACINCNACEHACPMNKDLAREDIPETYVARDRRKNILSMGTSGSVFTSIMEAILNRSGVIYGVIVDTDNVVKHVRVDSLQDPKLQKIPCSKYVKSEIRGIFPQVKRDLIAGKMVCFSGVPCQIAGLKCYLGKDYNNLFTVDVVCRGNPSPLFWKRFVDYIEAKYKSKIVDVKFRNKTYGYHSGTMRVSFENGKRYFASSRTNVFLRAFFSDLCSRPSCYDCYFKNVQHVSDLTLYDSWHAADLAEILDDDKGYTNVIVQSEKGKLLLEGLSSLEIYRVDTLKAIELDGIMVNNSIKWNSKREQFFENIELENTKEHCLKFMNISLKDYFVEKMKRIYYFKKFSG